MSLIKCENLSFAYDGVTVVSDLNFTVEEGNYLCIIGENGAGKSTLIKGLLRLKKPSAGTVEMGEGLKATEIGYLPQQTQIQKDFPASVREVVLSGCLNRMGLRPFYSRAEKERARENMEALEILDLQDQCYRDLSGGQQQRVLLARAMCAAQKMILLDEPVSGLDPVATRSLYEQISHINEAMGITVIMVSHDIDASLKNASHILHLGQEGQLFFGTRDEYRRSAVYHEFLGDRAVPMWKHGFPNRTGKAAPKDTVEPTETESRVKISTGRKAARKTSKAEPAAENDDRKAAKPEAAEESGNRKTSKAEPEGQNDDRKAAKPEAAEESGNWKTSKAEPAAEKDDQKAAKPEESGAIENRKDTSETEIPASPDTVKK